MEVSRKNEVVWLDKSHPNYERWKRARELSVERGLFVKKLISEIIKPENLIVLDFGSGEGGTSSVFAKENKVISFDVNLLRLIRQGSNGSFKINGSAGFLPFRSEAFELVILQDVIEHLPDPDTAIYGIYNLLKPGGILYLSTPNRFSLINLFADPHWGLPLLALFKRNIVKNFFLKYFRNSEYQRDDIAELLSLNQLKDITEKYFRIKLMTKFAVSELLEGNKGLVWSDFHLTLLKTIHKLRLGKLIQRIANNKPGFINRFLTPAFYCVMIKI
ncbi:MAG: hypothetical protein Kow0098_27710 [Ignavibacteriaceae bacterium]